MRKFVFLLSLIILMLSLFGCGNKGKTDAELPKYYDNDKMFVRGDVLSITTKRYAYNGDASMLSNIASYEPIVTTETKFAPDGLILSSNSDHSFPTGEGFSQSFDDNFDNKGRLSHRVEHLQIGNNASVHEWFYEYDDKDNLMKKTFNEEGKNIQWVVSYEYLKTDSKGNWIQRIENSDYTDKNGRMIDKYIETRDISYYSE